MEPSPTPGYAKLLGRIGTESLYEECELIVQKLPSTVGRTAELCIRGNNISIDATLSRNHATFDYDKQLKSFTLTCCSKNGMYVDKIFYSTGDKVKICNYSRIRLGPARFFFLLPLTDS